MKNDLNKVYTKQQLLDQLAQMNVPQNKVVLMHSSLRLVGKVEGGVKTLLDAMIEYFTADGGLFCVPTHTWANTKKEITLDMSSSATCLGAFSDFVITDPRGIRSQHPTHSMMVFGDRRRALDFIAGETAITSCTSPESCYGKLYREGGYVLLVGVAQSRNTYMHCVEEMLDMPNRLTEDLRDLTVKLESGEIVHHRMKIHLSGTSNRFPKYETAFRYHGAITDGFIGNAPTQACDARIIKETMEKIWKNSGGIDPLADENPIPPVWYC